MKKILLPIIIVFSIAAVIVPGIGGYIFKRQYYSTIEKFNAKHELLLQLNNYKLGWFSSALELNIKLKNNNLDYNQEQILTFNQTIKHSPFILHFSKNIAEIKSYFEKDLTKITAITAITFSGKNKTTLEGKFNQDDFAGLIEHNKDWSKFNANLSAQHLKFNLKNIGFNLTNPNVNIVTSNSKKSSSILLTNQTFKTGSLVINHKDQDLIKLEQLEISSQALPESLVIPDNNYLNFLLNINIEKSEVLQQKFASNKYTLQLNKLPESALAQFQQGKASFQLIPTPLLKEFGQAETTLELIFPKNITQYITSAVSLEIYKNSINGKIDARQNSEITQDITKHIQNNFQDLVNKKIFINNSDHYKLQMAFNTDGQVLVNDRVVY